MDYYISPPFGMRTGYRSGIRVMGTYTREARPGWWKQTLRTLRKVPGGWRNKIGLRNPGIDSIGFDEFDPDRVYSVAALEPHDWMYFTRIPQWAMLELNVGCPNTDTCDISDQDLAFLVDRYAGLAVKYGPFVNMDTIRRHHEIGVRRVHLSNTVPSALGGISGSEVKKYNLPQVKAVRDMNLSDLHITAGGGVYLPSDVWDYVSAGAHSISLATIFLTPWRLRQTVKTLEAIHISG